MRGMTILLAVAAFMACGDEGDTINVYVTAGGGTTGGNGTGTATGAGSSGKDSDGDGVTDADELALGLDPEQEDSDGDGYSDGDELDAGSDPLDANDVIYQGGWPYNADKDQISGPSLTSVAQVGGVFGEFSGVDQFGDTVSLYDFAGHGKPVLLHRTRYTMSVCNRIGIWANDFWEYAASQNELEGYRSVSEAIEAGDVYWVTVIGPDEPESFVDYYVNYYLDAFPMPVLYDPDGLIFGHLGMTDEDDCPVVALGSDMVVTAFDLKEASVAIEAVSLTL